MATIQAGNIADLITTTLKQLGRFKFTEIASDLQRYVAWKRLMRKNRVKFRSGTAIQWNVMVDDNGAAKNEGLYAVNNVNVPDVQKVADIPWRHTSTSYSWDLHEVTMNSGESEILDIVKSRKAAGMISYASKFESNFWSIPAAGDTLDPFGLPYWVIKPTSYSADGFVTNDHANFSSGRGNISTVTYPNWSNWYGQYTTINDTDFMDRLREAATKTNFVSPIEVESYNTGDDYAYYTNYAVRKELTRMGRHNNDSLGDDLDSKFGTIMFRGRPITYVPKLDADTNNPFYGVNWGVFNPVILSGWFLKQTGPIRAPNQRNVLEVFVDTTMNFRCADLRRLFLLATG